MGPGKRRKLPTGVLVSEIQIIGARVRAARELKGWTQGQLAYKAGTVAAQISRIEHNERPGAQARLVAAIAEALGVSLDYLLGRTGDPQFPPPGSDDVDPHTRQELYEFYRLVDEIRAMNPEAAGQLVGSVHVMAEAVRTALMAQQVAEQKEEDPKPNRTRESENP